MSKTAVKMTPPMVTAGLAATDRRLVPYGALTATFHTGLGCLMGPSILYFCVRALVG